MAESWHEHEERHRAQAGRDAALIRERLAAEEAGVRSAMARKMEECGALSDALADLERIAERSPDPDSRMWARSGIVALRRIWEPDDE